MALLLGSHPNVATVGEITVTSGIDVESYLCSCGNVIRQCSFWTGINDRMEKLGQEYDISDPAMQFRSNRWLVDRVLRPGVKNRLLETVRSSTLTLLPGPRREYRALLRRNEDFVHSVTEELQRPAFLDISKHPNRLLLLRQIPAFQIRVIYLVRDARAVTQSCRKNLGFTTEQGSQSWRKFAIEAERVRRYFSRDHWFMLRYEDLCRDPDGTMSRLFEYLDLSPNTDYRDFQSREHHIIGNRMRLGSSSEIRIDERWKSALADKEIRIVNRIAGKMNLEYGNDSNKNDST